MATKSKDLFIVEYGAEIGAVALGLRGPFALIFTFIMSRVLGKLVDLGIYKIDLKIDKIEQAFKSDKWRSRAIAYYEEAGARIYTEEEKDVIRKKYEQALADYATFGK